MPSPNAAVAHKPCDKLFMLPHLLSERAQLPTPDYGLGFLITSLAMENNAKLEQPDSHTPHFLPFASSQLIPLARTSHCTSWLHLQADFSLCDSIIAAKAKQ